jgi:hypothetical protein
MVTLFTVSRIFDIHNVSQTGSVFAVRWVGGGRAGREDLAKN